MTEPRSDAGLGLTTSSWLAIAAIFAAGLWLQLTYPTTTDVSWFFVVGEKVLAGERLYVDILEINPPMSLYLYLPAVLLEHITGVAAEFTQIGLMLGLVAGSMALAAAIMAASGRRAEVGRFLVAAAFVLVVQPMLTFSQREHIATIAALPFVMLMVARAGGHRVPIGYVILAGLGGGLAAAIKPHFAVALILPALYAAVSRHSWRPLLGLEAWIAVVVVVAYAGFLVLAYPVYFDTILPIAVDTYRQARVPILDLLANRPVIAMLLIGVSVPLVGGAEGRSAKAVVPLLAALGFFVAFLEQAKGWPYHLYPALALVYLTFLVTCLPRLAEAVAGKGLDRVTRYGRLVIGCVAIAGLAGTIGFLKYNSAQSLPLVPVIEKLAPKPTLLAISHDPSVGQPLARLVGGTWVGSAPFQWIAAAATARLAASGIDAETRARMQRLIGRDLAILATDIRSKRPDVILLDRARLDVDGLLAESPELAVLLGQYRTVGQANGVDLLLRQDLAAGNARIVGAAGVAP
ncbi:MAG: hypothetical protein P4L98_10490 [Ancalomicrobiaceae bacterium]|nr:hypothetical protein [Ancalomicrobiaceae bacterium]